MIRPTAKNLYLFCCKAKNNLIGLLSRGEMRQKKETKNENFCLFKHKRSNDLFSKL